MEEIAVKNDTLVVEKPKSRETKFEVLRIISMIMILFLHAFFQNNFLNVVDMRSANGIISWLLEGICLICVNIYVLISGFFLCTSKFKLKKIVKIIAETIFYSVAIYLIFCIFGGVKFDIKSFITGYLFPIMHGEYWFATVYVALYFIFPFLNVLVNNISQKAHLALLVIMFVMFSLIPTFVPIATDVLGIGSGLSLIWFIALYFTAAYFKKYVKAESIKPKMMFLWSLIFGLLTFVGFYAQWLIFGSAKYFRFYSYNSVFVLLSSICLFLSFMGLKNKERKTDKIVLKISAATFGVYLIHMQTNMNPWLWGLLKPWEYVASPWGIPYIIGVVLVIFVACTVIDIIRGFFADKFFGIKWVDKCINKVENGFKNAISKFIDRKPKNVEDRAIAQTDKNSKTDKND